MYKNLWFGNWWLLSFKNISPPIDNNVHIKTETTTHKWKLFNMKTILKNIGKFAIWLFSIDWRYSVLIWVMLYSFACSWWHSAMPGVVSPWLVSFSISVCESFNNVRCNAALIGVIQYSCVIHQQLVSWCG